MGIIAMICGIDEVGRGCVAGDMLVCGCILKKEILGLRDSKKLSEKKRNEFYEIIIKNSDFKFCWYSSELIDEKGLSWCLKDSILQIQKELKANVYIMDGNTNFNIQNVQAIIKADDKIPSVSAASILAKVTRDEYMQKMHELYPHYAYNSNKGYLSKAHLEAIRKFGISPIQRKSFKIKEFEKNLFN